MANAKIIIELEGVEAGGKMCGECRLLVFTSRFRHVPPWCLFFATHDSGHYPFRLPACLAAEEEAEKEKEEEV